MKITRLSLLLIAAAALAACGDGEQTVQIDPALRFNPDGGVAKTITLPCGAVVEYTAYEGIYYVTNVEDSTYQTLNIYVPNGTGDDAPILLRTYVGGYMAAKAMEPSATDATGRALAEGMVVCVPGARGWNSSVERGGATVYTGRAPNALLDLKAAVRYLRANDDVIPGSSEKIITDGTSAGGAMSSLLGVTGNAPQYDTYLEAMGAAKASDDVFASVCYCPIIDLDHADMAYEWLYSRTNDGIRALTAEQKAVSEELAAAYPDYLNSLGLLNPADGTAITADNYLDYLKTYIIASAQRARDEGCDLPDGIGIITNAPQLPDFGGHGPGARLPEGAPAGKPRLSGREAPSFGPGGVTVSRQQGEFVVDVDWDAYLTYVVSTAPLKTPPAFDAMGVLGANATPENQVFGDSTGSAVNFSSYSAAANGASIDEALAGRVAILNPMNFVDSDQSVKARHWYIRHGARDRDTAFPVPVNFATKLMNAGYDVDFRLPWNRPHSGDYNLDDLFEWIHCVAGEWQ